LIRKEEKISKGKRGAQGHAMTFRQGAENGTVFRIILFG
jgi:hypothetical protein